MNTDKILLFNKTRKEYYEELLVSCRDEQLDDYKDMDKEDIKNFYNNVKENENEFLRSFLLDNEVFYNASFSLKNKAALLDSFDYTSYLYLISTRIVHKNRLHEVSKLIREAKARKEQMLSIAPKQFENISNKLMSDIATNPEHNSSGGMSGISDIINEVLSSVKEETKGADLSKMEINPSDIIGSISSKKTNDSLKEKSGIDFGNLIASVSSKLEGRIKNGEIDISKLQKMFK